MSDSKVVYDRGIELVRNQALAEQVDRIYPALRLIQGDREVMTRERAMQVVAMQIAILDGYPDLEVTACDGGIMTTRGPGGYSYMIHLWAGLVNVTELELRKEKNA